MTTEDKLSVLVTTSGIGSRLGDFTKYSNKCLVKVGDMPVITRILNSYPENTDFYITLGHKGDLVRQYLDIAHPNKVFQFIKVDKYKGEGSSLAYSLLAAKSFLQKPFIYHACDTIVENYSPSLSQNWIGGYRRTNSAHYTTINVQDDIVKRINPKGETNYDYEYIGVSGIVDYKMFWEKLEDLYNQNPNDTSLNDALAINEMIRNVNFKVKIFSQWSDIGNMDSLNKARKFYSSRHIVLDKNREAIYFLKDKVVKFFKDSKMNRKRVERVKHLNGLSPKILSSSANFYSYEYLDGMLAADSHDKEMITKLLDWSRENLWKNQKNLGELGKEKCRKFYYDKTFARVEDLLEQIRKVDGNDIINGSNVPSVKSMMLELDENLLLEGDFCNFHGDFILDNIIITRDGFGLIDWRQDFSGNVDVGDVYYDLAKLNHNLFFNHNNIESGLFDVKERDGEILVDLKMNYRFFLAKQNFDMWCSKNGYDIKKINILTSIIWINMSPLHSYPLNKFLFYFGKFNLHKEIIK